jgi:molybdenum cofactor biosynthesis enzyme MoaA
MRFPLRLTADLTFGLVARALLAKRRYPLILNLVPDETSGAVPATVESPVVWIGGPEPLEQPEIAAIANTLTASGRHVFLQINGLLLRRRIHEFQPSPRLYLTIRFDGTQKSHDARAGNDGAFRAALEAIRAAKLSGFLICAHVILHADRDAGELAQLHDELRKLDLDGLLISPATLMGDLQGEVAEARRRLSGRRWALLSSLLDSAVSPATLRESAPAWRKPLVKSPSSNCEEGVQVP